MRTPADPPPGLIPVPMKSAVLLLTAPEFKAGIRRGKAWRRPVALRKREATSPSSLVVASGDPPGAQTGPDLRTGAPGNAPQRAVFWHAMR